MWKHIGNSFGRQSCLDNTCPHTLVITRYTLTSTYLSYLHNKYKITNDYLSCNKEMEKTQKKWKDEDSSSKRSYQSCLLHERFQSYHFHINIKCVIRTECICDNQNLSGEDIQNGDHL